MEKTKRLKKESKLKKWIKAFFANVFKTPKRTILYTGLLLSIVLLIYFLFIYFVRDNFYNNFSDDSLQYYPFMVDFINDIKSGNFSLYQFENYLGASFFSDTYYLPLDFFTLVILILSYIVEPEVAMSIVELLKMVLAVVVLMTYLNRINVKTKVMHIIGLMYFASSGMACFSAFPCFTSLSFYLPLSLIVIDSFINKKNWFYVPLFSMCVVLYNFYLAYTVFAFMCFAGLVIILKTKPGFIGLVKKEVFLVILILFGLLMGMGIFLPSFLYITNSTSRSVASEGSFASLLEMFKEYVEVVFELIKSIILLPYNILKDGGSIFNTRAFNDSFVSFNKLIETVTKTHTVGDKTVKSIFFGVEEYFRIMNTTYSPLTPTSFYGYQESYFIEHMSMYVTGFGLLMSAYVFELKGRIPRIYKWMFGIVVIFLSLPAFSYIFSGDLDVLYTRWINTLSIPLLIVAAYTLNEVGFDNFKFKKILIPALVVIFFGIFASAHHLDKLTSIASNNSWSEELIKLENIAFIATIFAFIMLSIGLIFLGKIKTFEKKTVKRAIYTVLSIISLVFIVAAVILVLINALSLSSSDWTTSFKNKPLYSTDVMLAYQYLGIATLVLLVIEIYGLVKKKYKLLFITIGIEILLGSSLSLGIAVVFEGKVTTFNKTRELGEYLSENIEEDELSRVYIDSSIDGYITSNVSKMIGIPSNENVFHSFINSATDEVAELLFNKKTETQAGKYALNSYSYYLGVVLGYKYVVTSASSKTSYTSAYYELVSSDDDPYKLYRFKDFEEFLSYDTYITKEEFENITPSSSPVTNAKVMLENLVVDAEVIEKYSSLFGERDENEEYDSIDETYSIQAKKTLGDENKSYIYDEEKQAYYFVYKFEGEDEVTTRSYAINIYSMSVDLGEYLDSNYLSFTIKTGADITITKNSMNGSVLHIPVYGNGVDDYRPNEFRVYAGETEPVTIPNLQYTVEAIIPSSSYIESYESGESLPSGEGLNAAHRYKVNKTFTGMVQFNLYSYSTKLSMGKVYIEYEDHEIVPVSGESTYDKKILYVYVVKTSESTKASAPPTLKISAYDIENNYSDNYTSKSVKTDHNKITVSYEKIESTGYSIIMIPTAYSTEWKVREGNIIDIIKVDGGFIGLIVDSSITSNTITLEFVPDGLRLGESIASIAIYLYLYLLIETLIKRRDKKLWKL